MSLHNKRTRIFLKNVKLCEQTLTGPLCSRRLRRVVISWHERQEGAIGQFPFSLFVLRWLGFWNTHFRN